MSDKTFALDWAGIPCPDADHPRLTGAGRAGNAPRTPHGFVATLGAVKAAHDLLVARSHPDLATVFYLLLRGIRDDPAASKCRHKTSHSTGLRHTDQRL